MRINEAVWLEKYNRWQIKVQKEGVRKTFYSSASGKKGKIECEQKADKFLSNGIVTDNIRFEKAYNQFLEYTASHTGTGNIKKHTSIGNTWLLPDLKHKKVSAITNVSWQTCIDKAYKAGRAKKTLENIRASITAFRSYCQRAGIEVLPVYDITIPDNATVKEKIILQPDELKHVMSLNDKADNYIYAYQFFIVTGLRPGELCGLKTADISDNVIHIKRNYNEYGEFTRGKTKKANRKFILSNVALEVLNRQNELKKRMGIISPFVFPNLFTNEALRSLNLSKHWRKFRDKLEIKSTLYELRHTFVSINKAYVPEELMKLIVGHTKNMDTYGVYGHLVSGEIEKASELVNINLKNLLS